MFADSFGCRMKCRIHQKVQDSGSYRGNLRTKDLLFLYASCQKKKENVSSLNVFSPWQCQQKTAKKFVPYFLVTKALGGQFREHNIIYRCKHLHFLRSAQPKLVLSLRSLTEMYSHFSTKNGLPPSHDEDNPSQNLYRDEKTIRVLKKKIGFQCLFLSY